MSSVNLVDMVNQRHTLPRNHAPRRQPSAQLSSNPTESAGIQLSRGRRDTDPAPEHGRPGTASGIGSRPRYRFPSGRPLRRPSCTRWHRRLVLPTSLPLRAITPVGVQGRATSNCPVDIRIPRQWLSRVGSEAVWLRLEQSDAHSPIARLLPGDTRRLARMVVLLPFATPLCNARSNTGRPRFAQRHKFIVGQAICDRSVRHHRRCGLRPIVQARTFRRHPLGTRVLAHAGCERAHPSARCSATPAFWSSAASTPAVAECAPRTGAMVRSLSMAALRADALWPGAILLPATSWAASRPAANDVRNTPATRTCQSVC